MHVNSFQEIFSTQNAEGKKIYHSAHLNGSEIDVHAHPDVAYKTAPLDSDYHSLDTLMNELNHICDDFAVHFYQVSMNETSGGKLGGEGDTRMEITVHATKHHSSSGHIEINFQRVHAGYWESDKRIKMDYPQDDICLTIHRARKIVCQAAKYIHDREHLDVLPASKLLGALPA